MFDEVVMDVLLALACIVIAIPLYRLLLSLQLEIIGPATAVSILLMGVNAVLASAYILIKFVKLLDHLQKK